MYVGCYTDTSISDMGSRDFDQHISEDEELLFLDMTVPKCMGACATLGYRYAALSVSCVFFIIFPPSNGKILYSSSSFETSWHKQSYHFSHYKIVEKQVIHLNFMTHASISQISYALPLSSHGHHYQNQVPKTIT